MGWRFQKRVRIFKGLTLNLGKKGASFTIGRPGASINVSRDKVTANVGIPGTGISYRETIAGKGAVPAPAERDERRESAPALPEQTEPVGSTFLALMLLLVLVAVLLGLIF